MLTDLKIQNYALIDGLEMQPSPLLNVITGETGAGKSIMLGAIGLLLGNRADSKVLWDAQEKCIIEGSFDISPYHLQSLFAEEDLDYEDQTVFRREIASNGKSRAFINDTPVTLEAMKKIGLRLMDVHSQHETLELGNRLFQLHLIDAFAGNQKIESVKIELDDILSEVEKEESKIEFDPARTEEVKKRLSTIYQLLQKHRHQTIRQLQDLQESLQQRADKTSNLDETLARAKAHLEKLTLQLQSKGEELSKSREKSFAPLCKQITKLLVDLGIPNASLKIENEKIKPTVNGIDSIELFFSANKGITPRPLAQVASGGEFSRLMFSVKYVMAEKTALPTMILDEIDSGVSGEIAIQLGKMMKEMAKRHQLISISHLPQIAAKSDAHFFVYKDNSSAKTVSLIKKLTQEERVTEIAKMIGGATPSNLALENAKELIAG